MKRRGYSQFSGRDSGKRNIQRMFLSNHYCEETQRGSVAIRCFKALINTIRG
jgi:hypothetical protein